MAVWIFRASRKKPENVVSNGVPIYEMCLFPEELTANIAKENCISCVRDVSSTTSFVASKCSKTRSSVLLNLETPLKCHIVPAGITYIYALLL